MDENINLVEEKNQVMTQTTQTTALPSETKFCQHCGGKIHKEAVICTLCGRQVSQMMNNNQSAPPPQVVINNTNTNANVNANVGGIPGVRPKNKWVAFFLCLFIGFLGAHKFYEGKILLGILYLFTLGLGGFGVLIDLLILLFKPNPYYV